MDFEERKKQFMADYKALIEKYQVDFIAVPMYHPDGKGFWALVISSEVIDIKQELIKSPMQI